MKSISVFIGSSTEGLEIAETIQEILEYKVMCTIWSQDDFTMSQSYLDSLIDALDKYHFGIFVLTPDDIMKIRDIAVKNPRDNVIFELGLFMGRLGKNRTFMVVPRGIDDFHLPTDLLGIMVAEYNFEGISTNPQSVLNPACKKIIRAIDRIHNSKFKNVVQTLHYIATGEHISLFYNQFCGSLLNGLCQYNINLNTVPLRGNSVNTLVKLIPRIQENEAILINPEGITERQGNIKLLIDSLEEYPETTIIFVDREPPIEFFKYNKISFIGINNKRVGIMAAFTLHNELANMNKERAYLVADGPGGPKRSEWFVKAVKMLDPKANVNKVSINDRTRYDSGEKIRRGLDQFIEQSKGAAIGFFSGNDETASTICHHCAMKSLKNIRIVGCDATLEMMQWIDNNESSAIATMYNSLHSPQNIDRIIHAMFERNIKYIDPKPYPERIDWLICKDKKTIKLWEEAKGEIIINK